MNADVHALAGAYVLDALSPLETDRFARHLAECPACRLEVPELQAAAAQMGVAVAERPPEALRARVLRAVQTTRQASSSAGPLRRRRMSRLLAAAAAVLLILGLGVLALRPAFDDGGQASDNHVMAVMHAPDARSSTTGVHGGGSITVISSRRMAAAVVMGERLPPLDRAHDYQLWLVGRSGDVRSTGMLIDGSRSGHAGPMMVKGVRPGDQIALSMERAGGSRRPTTPLLAMSRRT
jgi:anti-sigma-K factor RskA